MRPVTWIGIIFILLGAIFVMIPFVEQYVRLEKIPSWIIYVYESGNFYFATSPILILISALIFLLKLFIR